MCPYVFIRVRGIYTVYIGYMFFYSIVSITKFRLGSRVENEMRRRGPRSYHLLMHLFGGIQRAFQIQRNCSECDFIEKLMEDRIFFKMANQASLSLNLLSSSLDGLPSGFFFADIHGLKRS